MPAPAPEFAPRASRDDGASGSRPARRGPRLAAVSLLLSLALAAPSLAAAPAQQLSPAPEVPAGAFGEGAYDGEQDRVAVRLLMDRTSVERGETFRVGVLFDLDPGWHIYWRSPGDSGLPTELHWEAAGAAIGPLQWATPHTFAEADGLITTYGYSNRVLLYANARVSDGAGETLEVAVKTRFLACEITCVPGDVTLERSVPVATSASATPAVLSLFDAAVAERPVALDSLGFEAQVVFSQSAVRPRDEFEATIALGCQGRSGCSAPELADDELGYAFIPDLVEGVELTVTGTRPHPLSPGDWLIELRGRAGAAAQAGDQPFAGIAALRNPATGQPIAAEFSMTLPRASADSEIVSVTMPWDDVADSAASSNSAAQAAVPEPATFPLGRALALALLGGLILNLMPCVLPVLAIKVFAMTELAHKSRREVMAHGAAYGIGVVGSMWVLAGAVIALRAGGETVGWGFQFQDPMFVAAISAVLVVFALNLFGVFEIFAPTGGLAGVGAGASGPRRSFFEGLLAVVLATPCSAPFLGTAVGFAFAGSAATIVAIFTAIGLGLAAPFILVTLVPAWARFMPRSGAWMGTLRAGLGFAVLATVVWLLWVVGRLVGTDGIAALLAFLVAVAFATWTFGLLQAAGRLLPARGLALTASIASVLMLSALPFEPTAVAASQADSVDGTSRWEPSELRSTLASGQPAFVYFTADWCITCKVNERGTLASEPVQAELAALGFRVFKGDWTQRDAMIAKELAHFGKGGVPMYLVYDPSRPDAPMVLPELLTPSSLIDALRAAAPGA